MPASHDFSGSSTKAALSSEESLNEESLCKEPKLAEPFCEEAFEGWSLGEAPCLPASAASDANAGTTVFAGAAAGAAASLDAATGLTAFAGAPVDSTTFAGAIATTGFPQFVQNLASRGSFVPHFVQYMPAILCLIRFFSLGIVSPGASGTCQRPHYARMPSRFFYPIYSLFQERALLYATQETLEQTKSIQRQLAYIGATSTIGAIEAWHK